MSSKANYIFRIKHIQENEKTAIYSRKKYLQNIYQTYLMKNYELYKEFLKLTRK